MRRAFEVDVLACPRCGGRLRLVALIEASAVARRILRHLGLPADVPRPSPARASVAMAAPRGGCQGMVVGPVPEAWREPGSRAG